MKRTFLLLLIAFTLNMNAQIDSLQVSIDYLQGIKEKKLWDKTNTEAIQDGIANAIVDYNKPTLISFFNVSTEADHLVNTNQIANDSICALRSFVLVEKGLPKDGIIAEGGKHPYGFTFSLLPNREGRGSWDANFFQNFMRFKAMKNQVDILIGVPEVIVQWDSPSRTKVVFADFLYKNWQMWQYGSNPTDQFNKIYEHFYYWLSSMTIINEDGDEEEIFDFVEIANEPWGMTNEEFKILESARVEAWLKYNRDQGRYPKFENGVTRIDHLRPRLGTCAVPLGQGYTPKAGSMTPIGMVSKYAKYYSYVSGHVYNIDDRGWSDDFTITQNQIQEIEKLRIRYFPNASLFISEIGNPQNGLPQYVENVVAELSKYLKVMGVGWYSLRPIPNPRFEGCYFQDANGNDTKGMDKVKKLTVWKKGKIRA